MDNDPMRKPDQRMILMTEKQFREMQPPHGFGCVIASIGGLLFWAGFAIGWLVK
jgi:hypothetical protein